MNSTRNIENQKLCFKILKVNDVLKSWYDVWSYCTKYDQRKASEFSVNILLNSGTKFFSKIKETFIRISYKVNSFLKVRPN